MLGDECIWMKAGVVTLHICNNVYDCFDCGFDKAMTKAMGINTSVKTVSSWAKSYKGKYDGTSRPCRHVLTGRIQQSKICTHNYECHDCAFDQMLDDIEISEIQSKPEYANLSATGGELVNDFYGLNPEISWEKLVSTFLKT